MSEKQANPEYKTTSTIEQTEKAYREAVIKYFEEVYPINSPDLQVNEKLNPDPQSLALERAIEKEFTEFLLLEYGIRQDIINEITETEKMGMQAWKIPNPENFLAPKLPDTYAFSGGVARAGLLRALKIKPNAVYRDIDIVRFGGASQKTPEDVLLESTYMPEDSMHGYGVQRYPSPETYLLSRDLTISEIYMDQKHLVFTPQCLLDTIRGIVRLTDFERRQLNSVQPKTKILAKAVRILAQGIVENGDFYMDNEISTILNEQFIAIFYQALHFLRSMEHSEEAAREYLRILKKHNSVPKEINTLDEFTAYLAARLRDKSEFFRKAPVMQKIFENDLAEISVRVEEKLSSNEIPSLGYGEKLNKGEINHDTALKEARNHLELTNTTNRLGRNKENKDDREYDQFFKNGQKKYRLR